MLAWFRAHASRIATMAMVSLVALGVSAVSPHVDDCHDSGCLTIGVEHDADRASIHRASHRYRYHHCTAWSATGCARSGRGPKRACCSLAASEAGTLVHFDPFAVSVAAPAAQPPSLELRPPLQLV